MITCDIFITVKLVKIYSRTGTGKLTAVVSMDMTTIAMAECRDVEVGWPRTLQ